jgi:hypothetical protein
MHAITRLALAGILDIRHRFPAANLRHSERGLVSSVSHTLMYKHTSQPGHLRAIQGATALPLPSRTPRTPTRAFLPALLLSVGVPGFILRSAAADSGSHGGCRDLQGLWITL